jgi:hypothetical protein
VVHLCAPLFPFPSASVCTVRVRAVTGAWDASAGRQTDLFRRNHAPSQEPSPQTVHAHTVLLLDLLCHLRSEPVGQPATNGGGIVDADGLLRADFESATLELLDHPAQRARSIGTGEDVLAHEQTPTQTEQQTNKRKQQKSVQFHQIIGAI